MSRKIKISIKICTSERRTDHSEQVENKIKEVVVVGSSAIEVADKSDAGVIL